MSVVAFTACSDEIGDDSQSYSQTPAADVAGTYKGLLSETYTDPSTNTAVYTDYEVSTTISAVNGQPYVINLTQSAYGTEAAKTALANISSTSTYYPFTNKTATEAFGTFAGNVTDGVLTYSYSFESTVLVKKKPKKITKTYSFYGTK